MILNKITTRYSAKEDRILICAASDSGEINLWLTLRLMKKLVPSLIEWLEKSSDIRPETTTVDNEEAPKAGKAMHGELDSVLSNVIKKQTQPIKKVPLKQDNPSVLVQSIRCRYSENGVGLAFKWSKEGQAQLNISRENLQAWLKTLHTLWLQAEWVDIWPEWMEVLDRLVVDEKRKKMH